MATDRLHIDFGRFGRTLIRHMINMHTTRNNKTMFRHMIDETLDFFLCGFVLMCGKWWSLP